jgi:hypothetical protein
MLCQIPFAASLLGMHAFRRARRGAISLMISTKNRQECGVWVVLDLAGGIGGRARAPRGRKSTGFFGETEKECEALDYFSYPKSRIMQTPV